MSFASKLEKKIDKLIACFGNVSHCPRDSRPSVKEIISYLC